MEEENKIELGPSCLDGIRAIQVWIGKSIIVGLNCTCARNGVLIEVRKRRKHGMHCILCTGVTGTDPKCQKYLVKLISGYCDRPIGLETRFNNTSIINENCNLLLVSVL